MSRVARGLFLGERDVLHTAGRGTGRVVMEGRLDGVPAARASRGRHERGRMPGERSQWLGKGKDRSPCDHGEADSSRHGRTSSDPRGRSKRTLSDSSMTLKSPLLMIGPDAEGLATIQVVNWHLWVVRMAHVAAALSVVALSACTSSTAPSTTSSSASRSPQPSPSLTTSTAARFATALAWAPDKRLFYAERAGTIRTFDGTTRRVFATVSTSTEGERGLLGLALSPTFDKDPFVYAFYSRADDLTRQRVVRWLDRGGTGVNLMTI